MPEAQTPELMTVRVFLEGGAIFEFQAAELTWKTSKTTGTLVELEWKGSVGEVPRYINLDKVIAITRQVEPS